VSSLVIFWESVPLVLSVALKILGVAIISVLAFLTKNKKLFIKTTLAFLFVNFLFGGVMYFVELTFNPSNIFYMNGTVYFDISVLFLVSMTLVCYGLLLAFDFFLRKRTSEKTLYKATIYFRDKSVTLNALYDTGNHLTDGIEGKPVVIVTLNSIKEFFSLSEIEYFKSDSITSDVPATLKSIVRIVPCSSINGNSLLKAFIPEEMIIESEAFKYRTTFFVVAVTNNALSLGEYNCLLNSDIFERGTKINEDKVYK
jgi:sigma-E processing peptidase SpoIIGA